MFGSHATGRSHRESDIDIGVRLDPRLDAEQRFDLRLRLGSELIAATHANDLDLVVLNDAQPELARAIVRGLPLFVRDPEAEREHVLRIHLLAAEMAAYLDPYRRRALERLAR